MGRRGMRASGSGQQPIASSSPSHGQLAAVGVVERVRQAQHQLGAGGRDIIVVPAMWNEMQEGEGRWRSARQGEGTGQ